MQVSKWGNSLAVRLPTALVKQLGLKEGDEIEIVPKEAGKIEISPDERRRQALERMRSLSVLCLPDTSSTGRRRMRVGRMSLWFS